MAKIHTEPYLTIPIFNLSSHYSHRNVPLKVIPISNVSDRVLLLLDTIPPSHSKSCHLHWSSLERFDPHACDLDMIIRLGVTHDTNFIIRQWQCIHLVIDLALLLEEFSSEMV